MKRVYISGKISGLDIEVYKKKFLDAERKLKGLGYAVFNPTKKGIIPGYTWTDYMKDDLKVLCDCDYIFFLDNWKESKGAVFEKEIAATLNIPILEIL